MEKIEQIRECNNCEWIGWASDCVSPKHTQSLLLCPECHETTCYVTPERIIELRDGKPYNEQSSGDQCRHHEF